VDVSTGAVTTLRAGPGIHSRPHWSPLGDFLTFEYEDPARPPDLYSLGLWTGAMTQLTFSNPPALACQKLVVPEPVSYPAMTGWKFRLFSIAPPIPTGPPSFTPTVVLPTSIFTIGTSWPNTWSPRAIPTGHQLPRQHRLRRDFERLNHDDWGIGDTQDCLHAARYLRSLAGIDPQRIAIYGGSYGGYMTICCLSHDPEYLFACGITKYGDSHLISSWAQCSRRLRYYTEIFLGHPARNRKVYLDGSPIFQVENVKKPALILHGLLDDIVPPQASEEWVEALQRAGKTFEYKTYATSRMGSCAGRTRSTPGGASRDFWTGIYCRRNCKGVCFLA